MNKVLTKTVIYRGNEISIDDLKENSNIKVTVWCPHGEREVRWNRRNQLCRKCCAEKGVYSTSKKGRDISWGDKISEAKKGKKFSEAHKKALIKARKQKLCDRLDIPLEDFPGFPTSGEQYKLRLFIMSAIRRNIQNKTVEEQDELIMEGVGYSIDELKIHLESKFQEGMSWDNYGEWHIDHVRPESWFRYNSIGDEQFKQCWALENLQPLWAYENISKSNHYEGEYRKPFFYMLCGQSGVGKTTVANKLKHKFNVVNYDSINVKKLDEILRNNWHSEKPILLDIPIRISTNIKKYQDRYDITPVFIIEDVDTVKSRIIGRGGNRTCGVERRYKRMQSLSRQYSKFTGTADEVLDFLNSLKI